MLVSECSRCWGQIEDRMGDLDPDPVQKNNVRLNQRKLN